MRQLSASGQQAVEDLARRHGFSADAVATMLDAVLAGNGGMAQFNHPEFGGGGQWMRGGMTMIGDMFNGFLKGRVDALCADLSSLVGSQPGLIHTGGFQSQHQGTGGQWNDQSSGQWGGQWGNQRQGGNAPVDSGFAGGGAPVSLFVPGGSGSWWPADLGSPSSTGGQNNVRYAYFAHARRLAIDVAGTVTVYDTLDHQIGGFSQQQSYGGSLTFTSQFGLVDVASLPVVSGQAGVYAPALAPAPVQAQWPARDSAPTGVETDIFAAIERLADLRGKGILTDAEFATKKAELLGRL